jgi:hypothetical protein
VPRRQRLFSLGRPAGPCRRGSRLRRWGPHATSHPAWPPVRACRAGRVRLRTVRRRGRPVAVHCGFSGGPPSARTRCPPAQRRRMRAAMCCSAPPARCGTRTGPRPAAAAGRRPRRPHRWWARRPGRSPPGSSRFARPGWGAVCAASCERGRDNSRRSSVSVSSALDRMMAKLSASGAGGSGTWYGAVSAWIAITDMWWATTSCSFRAMRARSSNSALVARSCAARHCCVASASAASRRVRLLCPIQAARAGSSRHRVSAVTRSWRGSRMVGCLRSDRRTRRRTRRSAPRGSPARPTRSC